MQRKEKSRTLLLHLLNSPLCLLRPSMNKKGREARVLIAHLPLMVCELALSLWVNRSASQTSRKQSNTATVSHQRTSPESPDRIHRQLNARCLPLQRKNTRQSSLRSCLPAIRASPCLPYLSLISSHSQSSKTMIMGELLKTLRTFEEAPNLLIMRLLVGEILIVDFHRVTIHQLRDTSATRWTWANLHNRLKLTSWRRRIVQRRSKETSVVILRSKLRLRRS